MPSFVGRESTKRIPLGRRTEKLRQVSWLSTIWCKYLYGDVTTIRSVILESIKADIQIPQSDISYHR